MPVLVVCFSAFLILTGLPAPASAGSAERPAAADVLDLGRIRAAAEGLPALHSILISQGGELLLEEYYAGKTPAQPANMKSASKSLMSALVGIAIERGDIEGVDQPIADFFPALSAPGVPEQKQAITIEHLLTMQSGLESTSSRNYGRWVVSDNWVEFVLNQPVQSEPGSAMIYSTGSTHLLSAIIARASGMSTREFAQTHLADPLGFRLAYWTQDPQGIYFGGNDLEITPRSMLAFGQLYLDGGLAGEERILPESWIDQSFTPHAQSPRGQGRYYGYGWWLRDLAGLQIPLAWGYGGQLIFVIRELDMVIVMTSDSTPRPDRFGHLNALYALAETHIIAPLVPSAAALAEGF